MAECTGIALSSIDGRSMFRRRSGTSCDALPRVAGYHWLFCAACGDHVLEKKPTGIRHSYRIPVGIVVRRSQTRLCHSCYSNVLTFFIAHRARWPQCVVDSCSRRIARRGGSSPSAEQRSLVVCRTIIPNLRARNELIESWVFDVLAVRRES